MAGITDIKKEFLRLLEENEEFRYAVAAKIGLLEILQKLEEHDRKFNEILERLDRHGEEIKKIWEEIAEIKKEIKRIWEKMEEHDRKFNEILAELREHRKKLEEHDRKFNEILERLDRHERILEKHTIILEKHSQMLGALGSDIGALTEATLSRFIRDDLIDELKLKGVRVLDIRRMHRINGYEVDLYIETTDEIIVVEVKTRPSISDIERLCRIKYYLIERRNKKVRAILASLKLKTTLNVVSEARNRGVELIVY